MSGSKPLDMSVFDDRRNGLLLMPARTSPGWRPSGIAWEAYKTMEDAQLLDAPDPTGQGRV